MEIAIVSKVDELFEEKMLQEMVLAAHTSRLSKCYTIACHNRIGKLQI